MKKILNEFWKYISNWWSNFYWNILQNTDKEVKPRLCDFKHKDETVSQFLSKMSRRLMDTFEYTNDGLDQLYDTTPPPQEAYSQFCKGKLKDDCDGYHAALYYIAHMNKIECRLLTILSTKNKYGHCVMVFKEDEQWKVIDYRMIFDEKEKAYDYYSQVTNGDFVNYMRVYDFDKKRYKIIKERYFQ